MREAQVSNRVRQTRESRGLTQQELADAVGVTRQTIGLIERQEYNPTIRLCLLMARALGVEVGAIFTLDESDTQTADAGPLTMQAPASP